MTVFWEICEDHELGHHFHGHCASEEDSPVLWEEFSNDDGAEGGFRSQAKEVDADGFAVHMMLRNFMAGVPRTKLLELLGFSSDTSDDLAILSVIVVATGSFFFYRQRAFDENRVSELTHPPPAVRMHYIVQELTAWIEEHRSAASGLINLPRYQDLMSAAARALMSKTSGEAWLDQSKFLQSDAGRSYLQRLGDARSQIREEMRNRIWELLPEGIRTLNE